MGLAGFLGFDVKQGKQLMSLDVYIITNEIIEKKKRKEKQIEFHVNLFLFKLLELVESPNLNHARKQTRARKRT